MTKPTQQESEKVLNLRKYAETDETKFSTLSNTLLPQLPAIEIAAILAQKGEHGISLAHNVFNFQLPTIEAFLQHIINECSFEQINEMLYLINDKQQTVFDILWSKHGFQGLAALISCLESKFALDKLALLFVDMSFKTKESIYHNLLKIQDKSPNKITIFLHYIFAGFHNEDIQLLLSTNSTRYNALQIAILNKNLHKVIDICNKMIGNKEYEAQLVNTLLGNIDEYATVFHFLSCPKTEDSDFDQLCKLISKLNKENILRLLHFQPSEFKFSLLHRIFICSNDNKYRSIIKLLSSDKLSSNDLYNLLMMQLHDGSHLLFDLWQANSKTTLEPLFQFISHFTTDQANNLLTHQNHRNFNFAQTEQVLSKTKFNRGIKVYLFLKYTDLALEQLACLEGEKEFVQEYMWTLDPDEINDALFDRKTSLGRYIRHYFCAHLAESEASLNILGTALTSEAFSADEVFDLLSKPGKNNETLFLNVLYHDGDNVEPFFKLLSKFPIEKSFNLLVKTCSLEKNGQPIPYHHKGRNAYYFLKNTNCSNEQSTSFAASKEMIEEYILGLTTEEVKAAINDQSTSLGTFLRDYSDELLGYFNKTDFTEAFSSTVPDGTVGLPTSFQAACKKMLVKFGITELSEKQANLFGVFVKPNFLGIAIQTFSFKDMLPLIKNLDPSILFMHLYDSHDMIMHESRYYREDCAEFFACLKKLNAEQWEKFLVGHQPTKKNFLQNVFQRMVHNDKQGLFSAHLCSKENFTRQILMPILMNAASLTDKSIGMFVEYNNLILTYILSIKNPVEKMKLLWECLQKKNSNLGKLFTRKSFLFDPRTPGIENGFLKDIYQAFDDLCKESESTTADIYKLVMDAISLPNKKPAEIDYKNGQMRLALLAIKNARFANGYDISLKKLRCEGMQSLEEFEIAQPVAAEAAVSHEGKVYEVGVADTTSSALTSPQSTMELLLSLVDSGAAAAAGAAAAPPTAASLRSSQSGDASVVAVSQAKPSQTNIVLRGFATLKASLFGGKKDNTKVYASLGAEDADVPLGSSVSVVNLTRSAAATAATAAAATAAATTTTATAATADLRRSGSSSSLSAK